MCMHENLQLQENNEISKLGKVLLFLRDDEQHLQYIGLMEMCLFLTLKC